VPYQRDFFVLQLGFGEALARVLDRPRPDVLLECTALRPSFALTGWVDQQHPDWRAFLDGLDREPDAGAQVDWAYAYYLERQAVAPPDLTVYHGCFSYAYEAERRTIRLHFAPRDASGLGALSRERMPVRLAELRAMFAAIRADVPDAETVRGGSWLYNVEAYRHLFPPAYLAAATAAKPREELFFMALWGQFLDRHGRLRQPLASDFLARVARQRDLEGVESCFPCTVLRPRCPIAHFYEHYADHP
jgi:hypothetical protein